MTRRFLALFAPGTRGDTIGRYATMAACIGVVIYVGASSATHQANSCTRMVWEPSKPGCPVATVSIPPERMIGRAK